MKKKTLLNAIIITLLIIAGASFIVAAFTRGTFLGLVAISVVMMVFRNKHCLGVFAADKF